MDRSTLGRFNDYWPTWLHWRQPIGNFQASKSAKKISAPTLDTCPANDVWAKLPIPRAGKKTVLAFYREILTGVRFAVPRLLTAPRLAGNHVAHMLHGLAGIDRKAPKMAGKLRNKMQHGISAPSNARFEKQSMFQRVYW
ncbi:MAG: hypothetical protein ACK54U_02130 [Sphingomonadales bacterium]|jgi:hypothetical protein